jgi:hypothetical protein
LDRLKVKGKEWNWTPKCQSAFDQIKAEFEKWHILLMPDKIKPFILETDASKVATGAVLQQYDENSELRLCRFIFQAFSPTE